MSLVSEKIFFRPSDYDERIMKEIERLNPQITNASDLIRMALRAWELNQGELDELKRRVEELEIMVKGIVNG